ncbi:hypothetical protein FOL47_008686 [Perkinsus chesapeaki]|uniref:EF-hand domain-containing protein n=1 Tax=Perkinsus chesapeaki TaxID=330153 RepID=A0A7J6MT78_PERCH|nr:hypothetical protein FOL47_008686 [Perkinsus chesapeaki]
MSPVPSTSSSKLNTSGVHTPQFLSSTTTTTLSGLQEGYSSEQWGPWRSHGLLLQQSIRQLKWQDNAAAILKLMAQYSSSVKSQQQSSLSRDEFIRLLHDHSVLDDDAGRRRIEAQHLWDVFDRDQDGQLTETDLLAGLIAVDPFTPHDIESPSGMLRMQFIFLYFDEDRNGQLDLKEITALLMHLRQLRAV